MSEPSPKAKRLYTTGTSIPVIAQRSLKPKQPIKAVQIWLLFRRVLVLVAAIFYVKISLEGAFSGLSILEGVINHSIPFDPYQADYINSFAQPDTVHDGDVSTVDKGKLVNQVLDGNLTPRVNQTLYLHSPTHASLIECSNWTSEATQRMYSSVHLYKVFGEVVRDIAYAVPELVGTEMVLPIVDCSFTGIRNGDKSNMRAFYLMRKTNASDAFLITFSLSIQNYRFPDQHQIGSNGLLVLSIISDFTDDKVDHYYALAPGFPFRAAKYDVYNRNGLTNDGFMILESTPTVDEPTQVYHTAARGGVYRKTESEQAHLRNVHWEPSQKAALALSQWEWQGTYVRRDSWAWVHGLHFIFTADTCFNILVLLIVIYRNKLKGKVWIGDAFVSISKAAMFRALCVLVGWRLNGMWTAHKFMLEQGNVLGNVPKLLVFPALMHADLMLIYLGVVDLVGFVMCERIDPALSLALYEIGFSYRRELATLFPPMAKTIIEFARNDYAVGLTYIHPKFTAISPLD